MGSLYCSCIALLLVLQASRCIAWGNEYNYADALDKSLLFFEAQRSGHLPQNQRVKWRADSGLTDGFKQGVDLVGGYYDAGDHVKFGLPMAYSVTMLAWGVIDFGKEIMKLNQMGHALAAIKWGTDYFIKAHPQPNVLWAEARDGDSDHYCWERAEDMTTSRTAFKHDTSNPGSDVAAETAAAMAAAAIAFKHYNSSYSNLLLVHSKQLFSFADQFRGLSIRSIPNTEKFYKSSGYEDELLWAAAWLYQATGEDYYLKYVADNAVSMGGTGWAVNQFSWDNKYAAVQILLSKVLLEGGGGAYTSTLKHYQTKADYFACACQQKNDGYNVPMTPGGLLYINQWNNLQYAASAAFLHAAYSQYLSAANAVLNCPDAKLQPQDLLNFAKSQADYILGKNPKSMSYIVGYGQNYPVQVHHRGASIDPISALPSPVGCVQGYEEWYRRPEKNPNVIYGALVGGPNKNDEFKDERDNYEQTEPTISGTASLLGLFSKLSSSYGSSGAASNHQETPTSNTNYPQSSYPKEAPMPNPTSSMPVEFYHSITDSWTARRMSYYRHRVTIKNTSQKSIKNLRLKIENLSGSLWGLTPTQEKNIYELPKWIKELKPGSECKFVYVQGGPQAKVLVQSYN
ncbi:Endoglucanase [Heracleum sosnowskyi]|uniref:Endoglucanase n=1 Tax=Heracleum sosnowskyi TaxID=360622 RepID=A0AAD8MVK6_9APIA|nr:Endoglucanase [Heracleum sosnowskyi]